MKLGKICVQPDLEIKGVRVYTYNTYFPSTSDMTAHTAEHFNIDCSLLPSNISLSEQFSQLFSFVESVPNKRNIHVTLRFATAKPVGRKLKSMFQSLGCTVVMKTAF